MFSLEGATTFNILDEGEITGYGFFPDNESFFISNEEKIYSFSRDWAGVFVVDGVFSGFEHRIASSLQTSIKNEYIVDFDHGDGFHHFSLERYGKDSIYFFEIFVDVPDSYRLLGVTQDNRYFLIQQKIDDRPVSLVIIDSSFPDEPFLIEEGLTAMSFFTLTGKEGEVYYVTGYDYNKARFLYRFDFDQGRYHTIDGIEEALMYYPREAKYQGQSAVSFAEKFCLDDCQDILYRFMYLLPGRVSYGENFSLNDIDVYSIIPITFGGDLFLVIGEYQNGVHLFTGNNQENTITRELELDPDTNYHILHSDDSQYWFLLTRDLITSIDILNISIEINVFFRRKNG